MFVFDLVCIPLFFYRFAIILKRKRERADFFASIVFWMSCSCKSSVTFPLGAVGRSAVCDCNIS